MKITALVEGLEVGENMAMGETFEVVGTARVVRLEDDVIDRFSFRRNAEMGMQTRVARAGDRTATVFVEVERRP